MEETIRFSSESFELAGVLHWPENPLPPVVVGAHGLFASKDSPKQIALAAACNARGLAYFRFDHTGVRPKRGGFFPGDHLCRTGPGYGCGGEHRGDPAGCGAGPGTVRLQHGRGPCACTWRRGGLPGPWWFTAAPARFEPLEDMLRQSGEAQRLPQAFFQESGAAVAPCGKVNFGPLLVFHGNADQVVPVSHGREIHEKAWDPKRLIVFSGGDHPMSHPGHQKVFVKKAAEWFAAYLKE